MNPVNQTEQPEICDYEGSTYRTDFWEGKGRNYEDRVERIAIKRLLPTGGRRLLEIGAGFGRLTEEYQMYEQVVLLDYSFSQLQYARDKLGTDRYVYVAADVYQMPFRAGIFDGATMIRVIHHMADVPAVLAKIRRVMTNGGTFILEHANKRNLKAITRYALRLQKWNPYDHTPVEFVKLNFDFHPAYILEQLQAAGFTPSMRIPVSFLRLGLLKKTLPTNVLVGIDSVLQRTPLYVSPSLFVKTTAGGGETNAVPAVESADELFAAPGTGAALTREGDVLRDLNTGERWAIRDGIYDFKAPISDSA